MKGPILLVLAAILFCFWVSWYTGGPWFGATVNEMNEFADREHLYWKVEEGFSCTYTGQAWDRDKKSYQGPRWFVCGASPERTIAKLKNAVLEDVPEYPDREQPKWTNVPESEQ